MNRAARTAAAQFIEGSRRAGSAVVLKGPISAEVNRPRAGHRPEGGSHKIAPPAYRPPTQIGSRPGGFEPALAIVTHLQGGDAPPSEVVDPHVGDNARRRAHAHDGATVLVADRKKAGLGGRRRRSRRPRRSSGPVEFPEPAWHATAVQRIREHLHAGDTYQVNLTGLATAETSVPPFEHFLRHSLENPVPFGACLRICGVTITSHSPERLLRIEGDRAETAPIKGTIARSEDSRHLLRASEKDRAEHLMIVDLCRNDLGRRAVTGSVHVTELLEPLALRGIDHLVSRIEARVRPGGRGGLLDSLVPGGSVTGAPKRRAMEIITEVEKSRRGPYTGSIGYVTPGGDADFSIAIRTAVWSEERVWFGCGGGIVVDSEPESEYAEARLKAESFFATLERCSGR